MLPTNIVQTVQTYNKAELAFLQNYACFIDNANKKFKNFQTMEANLGSSVTFDLPVRATTTQGLIPVYQPIEQRTHTLTCNQAESAAFTVNDPERLFNLDKGVGGIGDYMNEIGRGFAAELATKIEVDLAKNADSSVRDQVTGLLQTNSGPYRFFGNSISPINTYQQLQQAVTNFKNFGSVQTGMKHYLPDTIVPQVVGSGLNQFAPNRNNEIAKSWWIGDFGTPPVSYYQSNLLPIHTSGTTGESQQVLTVISTNDNTGANITAITLSGASASDANAVKSGDLFQFQDSVSGQPNMRYLTFIGHTPSNQPVQFRAIADAGSDGAGHVVIQVAPVLSSVPGRNQNLNNNIAAGMQILGLKSHRCGLIVGGDAFYLAMPRLPSTRPFDSSVETDKTTGASLRMYYGYIISLAANALIRDATWGSTAVPEYCMRVIYPLTQA